MGFCLKIITQVGNNHKSSRKLTIPCMEFWSKLISPTAPFQFGLDKPGVMKLRMMS